MQSTERICAVCNAPIPFYSSRYVCEDMWACLARLDARLLRETKRLRWAKFIAINATVAVVLILAFCTGCTLQPYAHVSAEYPLNDGVHRYVEGERIDSPVLGVVEFGALFNLSESVAADCAFGHRSMLSTKEDRGEEYAKCGAVYFFGR